MLLFTYAEIIAVKNKKKLKNRAPNNDF